MTNRALPLSDPKTGCARAHWALKVTTPLLVVVYIKFMKDIKQEVFMTQTLKNEFESRRLHGDCQFCRMAV